MYSGLSHMSLFLQLTQARKQAHGKPMLALHDVATTVQAHRRGGDSKEAEIASDGRSTNQSVGTGVDD